MEKVEAIVLAKTPLGEADELIACYTKERGKLFFRARGVRKGRAKHAGVLQELNHVHIYFVEAKGGPLITETTLLESFGGIKSSVEKTAAAQTVSGTLVGVFPSEFPDMVLWWQLHDYLLSLESCTGDKGAMEVAPAFFLLSMLKMHGTQPEFEKCVMCGADLFAKDHYLFSLAHGGVVDGVCGEKDEEAFILQPPARAALITWNSLSFRDVLEQELSQETRTQMVALIDHFAKWHLGEKASALSGMYKK